jgi:F420-dependent oxidoreductase-like protein
MRVSISITDYSWPGDLTAELAGVAREAEEAGVDTLWLPDHLLQAQPGSDPDSAMLEAYTALGYLAAVTERVRLGTLVTAAPFREPALLVKAVTTLHVLAGGRAWLGIGAGYLESEARAFGVPLPPTRERFERLEEILQIAAHMWGDGAPYEGSYYTLERSFSAPRPDPRPRILIGGVGEKRTLRLVAQYADACNVFDIPDGGDTVRHKLDVLRRHCDAVGRDFDAIEKTLSTRIGPDDSPASFAERIRGLGIDHAIVLTNGPWTAEKVARLGDYIRNTP